ncbi:hypothetical protein HYH03_002549 [Edaphochlamys debaryana]|uniref:ACB domain-containing protein n=1 Tax=Edaphochlamys debaryana TaxID=47281 RepID=A0A835YKZ8_9CHLO|nr:hypothetical protein HYH03_002549 [Edaphochlamys debaryana]|eukprot:KAG2499609.1 hypothetical protein HYH03_002549 [Edaphochlamys debaryana]
MACQLPYPDKFQAAARFWHLGAKVPGAKALAQENQLLLYALNQQATVGPNNTSKPWGFNVVENTKWQGWKELGKMARMEAMRLFVKGLEEEQPDWWTLLQAAEASGAAPSGQGASEEEATSDASAAPAVPVPERAVLGVWNQLDAAVEAKHGHKKPVPRYEAAAAVVGGHVYMLGGNYGGRYLSDAWSLELATGAWHHLQLQPAPDSPSAAFPPTAGHSATAWQGKIYVLGGHTKAKEAGSLTLRVVDLATKTVTMPPTSGTAPPSRGGHAVALLGSQLWVYGGEDNARRALADVHVLDLATLTWSSPQVQGKAPAARSACAVAPYLDRYVLAFGGGSVATCFSDLHVLDTQAMTWSQPAQAGAKVSPRAGHSGAVLGDVWYIVGGGNNVKGCADLLAADLSALPTNGTITWHVVTSVALRDPLSSEGISLVALPAERVLLAFGGYNGKYQNAVSLYRAPEGAAAFLTGAEAAAATRVEASKANGAAPAAEKPAAAAAQAKPAAAAAKAAAAPAAAAGQGSAAATAAAEAAAAAAAGQAAELQKQVADIKAQLEGARREAESAIRESAAAKEGAAHELALLRKQLTAAQAQTAEANKALEEARQALAAEQSKVLKLEAQGAELQAKLGQMAEMERELDKYRRAEKEREAAAAKKGGGGIWGYVTGS